MFIHFRNGLVEFPLKYIRFLGFLYLINGGLIDLILFHMQPEYINDNKYTKKVLSKIKEVGIQDCVLMNNDNLSNNEKISKLEIKEVSTSDENFGWLLNLQVNNQEIDESLILSFFSKFLNKEIDEKDVLVIKMINDIKKIKNQIQDDNIIELLEESLSVFKNSIKLFSTLPDNVLIIGGSLDSCLIELSLTLKYLKKSFSIDDSLCYRG